MRSVIYCNLNDNIERISWLKFMFFQCFCLLTLVAANAFASASSSTTGNCHQRQRVNERTVGWFLLATHCCHTISNCTHWLAYLVTSLVASTKLINAKLG